MKLGLWAARGIHLKHINENLLVQCQLIFQAIEFLWLRMPVPSFPFSSGLASFACLCIFLHHSPFEKRILKKTPVNRSLDLGSLMKYFGAAGSGSGCHHCLPGVTVTMTWLLIDECRYSAGTLTNSSLKGSNKRTPNFPLSFKAKQPEERLASAGINSVRLLFYHR